MFTTNKEILFKELAKEEKDKFYNASKTVAGLKHINMLKNRKAEELLNKELLRLFPKSKAVKAVVKENIVDKAYLFKSNTTSLADLRLYKYDLYITLKKAGLF